MDPEKVNAALDSFPSAEAMIRIERILAILRIPTNLRVLLALEQELCLGDVSAAVGIEYAYTSALCGKLRRAGLITQRRDGHIAYFKAKTPLASLTIQLLATK